MINVFFNLNYEFVLFVFFYFCFFYSVKKQTPPDYFDVLRNFQNIDKCRPIHMDSHDFHFGLS